LQCDGSVAGGGAESDEGGARGYVVGEGRGDYETGGCVCVWGFFVFFEAVVVVVVFRESE
jgi:hypothetical protein